MTPEEREVLAAEVTAERIAQGLPPKIEDPVFYRKWAAMIDEKTRPNLPATGRAERLSSPDRE